MNATKRHLWAAASGWLLASLLVGCGGGEPIGPRTAKGVFYPRPPAEPRLQFLFTFGDAEPWTATAGGKFTDFIVGEKKKVPGKMDGAYGVAVRDGKIYVCDVFAQCIHRYDVVNRAYARIGPDKHIQRPLSMLIAPDGTKYVCEARFQKIVVLDANDQFVRDFGDPKTLGPSDIALYNNELYVLDRLGAEIEVWSVTGEKLRTISGPGKNPENLQYPICLDISKEGVLYVTDAMVGAIKVFGADGKYQRDIGASGDRPGYFARPKGLRLDPEGRIFVADSHWDTIQIFSPEGQLLTFIQDRGEKEIAAFRQKNPDAKSVPLPPNTMVTPTGLAIDTSCLDPFSQYIDKDFQAEFLVLVANQYNKPNSLSVLAFGHSRKAEPEK